MGRKFPPHFFGVFFQELLEHIIGSDGDIEDGFHSPLLSSSSPLNLLMHSLLQK
jgi:hypothetical protein